MSTIRLLVIFISGENLTKSFHISYYMYDASRYLAPFAQFKNVKNIYGGVILLVKVSLLHRCFSCFLNCANGTKSHKTSPLSFPYYYSAFVRQEKLSFTSCTLKCLEKYKDIAAIFILLTFNY